MGVLTQHGYDAAHLMGKFQGQKYAAAGLPLDSCSDMFVYCEEVGRVGSGRLGALLIYVGLFFCLLACVCGVFSCVNPRSRLKRACRTCPATSSRRRLFSRDSRRDGQPQVASKMLGAVPFPSRTSAKWSTSSTRWARVFHESFSARFRLVPCCPSLLRFRLCPSVQPYPPAGTTSLHCFVAFGRLC